MRIGIFGGTFNPITNAHLTIIEAAKKQMKLDQVVVVPSNISYMKDQETIAPQQDRYTMVRHAVANMRDVIVDDIEIQRGGNSYTYETLHDFHTASPNDELFLIIGADSLSSLDQWYNFKGILEEATLVVFSRDSLIQDDSLWRSVFYYTHAYNAKITVLDSFVPNISASIVRQLIKEGKSFEYLVPSCVKDYIAKNELYGYRRENYE